MDFKHPALRAAAMSNQMVRLELAGELTNVHTKPIEELQKLDCVPSQVGLLADDAEQADKKIAAVSDDFENTRRDLLVKWHGDAADAFAEQSLDLLAGHVAETRAGRRTVEAGREIAMRLDKLTTGASKDADGVATQVDTASVLVISGAPEHDEAAEVVRMAIERISETVDATLAKVATLGDLLDAV